MADQAEEHCTAPYHAARGSQPRQSKRRKTVTSSPSDTARRLLLVKYSAADQQEATAPTIDSSFVLPASQPTPSVIRDMVGNHQYPQLHVDCRFVS